MNTFKKCFLLTALCSFSFGAWGMSEEKIEKQKNIALSSIEYFARNGTAAFFAIKKTIETVGASTTNVKNNLLTLSFLKFPKKKTDEKNTPFLNTQINTLKKNQEEELTKKGSLFETIIGFETITGYSKVLHNITQENFKEKPNNTYNSIRNELLEEVKKQKNSLPKLKKEALLFGMGFGLLLSFSVYSLYDKVKVQNIPKQLCEFEIANVFYSLPSFVIAANRYYKITKENPRLEKIEQILNADYNKEDVEAFVKEHCKQKITL